VVGVVDVVGVAGVVGMAGVVGVVGVVGKQIDCECVLNVRHYNCIIVAGVLIGLSLWFDDHFRDLFRKNELLQI
jgi:hypothetical protein